MDITNTKRRSLVARDEMNLAEFPLAVLSTRSNSNVKTLEFCESKRHKSGQLVKRSWVITAADKFGLPTATDDDVVLGLMRLSMENGFRERKVYFTRYELMKALNWSTEGRNYSRLSKSLDRLSGVRIKATNAFYDNLSKSFKTVNFGIIDAYELNDSRGKKEKSFFIWSEKLFDSFQSGFIKKIDLDLYFSLDSAVSRRLYRFLDKHFYYRGVIEKNLKVFAFEKLGISRNYKYISQIKQQLEMGLEELKEKNFISHYEYEGRGDNAIIRLYSGASKMPVQEITPKSQDSISRDSFNEKTKELDDEFKAQFIKMLVDRGVAFAQALKVSSSVKSGERESLENIISYFDYLMSKDSSKLKNPGGFLYNSIVSRESFKIPKSFIKEESKQESYRKGKYIKGKNKKIENGPEQKESSGTLGRGKNDIADKNEKRKQFFFEYEKFLDSEIEKQISQVSKAKVEVAKDEVEQRLKCLKPVLSRTRYEQALDKAVREKLREVLGVPDYKDWLRLHKN